MDLGLSTVYSQAPNDQSRLRRLEVALAAGPVNLTDRLRVAGEIIWRGYWKRVDRQIVQTGQEFVPFPVPGFIDKTVSAQFIQKDYRNRLMGSVQVDFPLGARTDVSLKYSRRDIFDQDPSIFPRLFQSVINLGDVNLITLDQMEMRYNHQFRPGLEWRGNVGGAFFSDNQTNRRELGSSTLT